MRGEKWHWRNSHDLRRFQHTPGTYHGTLKHLFMKGIRSYLDFWNIWGMFQGSVGIYSDLIPHDFFFARGTKVQGRFPWVENLAERKKTRGSVFFQGGKNNEHKQLCRTTSRKNQRMLIYANILYMHVYIYISFVGSFRKSRSQQNRWLCVVGERDMGTNTLYIVHFA